MMWRAMSGAGNKFIVGKLDADTSIPTSVDAGIEGILTLDHTEAHRFDASFYNTEGSYGMMCGNGSRCIVRFAIDHGVQPVNDEIEFTLNEVSYIATVLPNDFIAVTFPPPVTERSYPIGSLEHVDLDVYYVDVHSDHVVIDGPLDEQRPIVRTLRHHTEFKRGTNVNMVELDASGMVRIATFERGVEAITGACGTGALSSAIALWRSGRTSDRVVLLPPSGKALIAEISHNNEIITSLTLIGDAIYDD